MTCPFFWWSAINDDAVILTCFRDRGDFSAELIRLADSLAAQDEGLAKFVDQHTEELQKPAFRRWVDDAGTDGRGAIERAATLALEELDARTSQ